MTNVRYTDALLLLNPPSRRQKAEARRTMSGGVSQLLRILTRLMPDSVRQIA
ncbi:hypothetical protein FRC0141_02200 [Corynebacterium diphtheriae]|nr:hypothetical protein CIP107537_02207 [Corynebacterium diphtheriae]CAB0623298.1 hypothetical protein CIP107557_02287 [Corynebacterium diphtheriae]CAB0624178.1 hypothetical protein CIP107544_02361 [Corynebacterium diphtheriae]CAB0667494.1 hypothetical protein CIP107563_02133 [Corynebacterium diphtheriae]CAB0739230.1 hypothetical protein FRC0086_02041 [Corynebacterium diphtheriae]